MKHISDLILIGMKNMGIWSLILANQPTASVQFNGTMAHVRCPRERKMTMLNALAALDSVVLDLHIKEPSLEDVFLGYSDATA